jgi:hypothetical protein
MKGWGRKADLSVQGDLLLSLIILGIFVVFVFPYISEHANGEAYFSKFYSVDLATSAELVNAGYGDVILRYDNLKQNLDLTFWFDNGLVVISKIEEKGNHEIWSYTPPPNAIGQYYGLAKQYPSGLTVISRPVFLVLRKADENFAITEEETVLKACPGVEPVVAREDANVYLEATGPGAEQIEAQFERAVAGLNMRTADKESANIHIKIERRNGATNSIEIYPTSIDGKAYSCLFAKRLHAITLIDFTTNEPSIRGTSLAVDMTITTASTITEEQIAQGLANALAVYYK